MVVSIGAEHLLNDFSSISLMARETRAVFCLHITSVKLVVLFQIGCFFENCAVEAFFDFFSRNVYFKVAFIHGIIFYLPYFPVVSCLHTIQEVFWLPEVAGADVMSMCLI